MKTALFSDIHGNTPALEAVLDDIRCQRVERVFVLGDIISGVDPHGCVDLLMRWGAAENIPLTAIKGNTEMYLLTPDLDALPERGGPWEKDVPALIRWCQSRLSQNELDWIASMPDYLVLDQTCLVHDSPIDRLTPETWHQSDIAPKYQEWFHHARGVLEDMPEDRWQDLLDLMDRKNFTRVFCGHSHRPFLRQVGHRVICNTGSVGAPLDGDPRAVWVLVDEPAGREAEITIQRVVYDLAAFHALVDATGDYPDFQRPGAQERYKLRRSTGGHG